MTHSKNTKNQIDNPAILKELVQNESIVFTRLMQKAPGCPAF